jgi:peptide/nickel transport system substrate-binding protein
MDRDLVGSGRYQFVSHENGTNFKIRRFPNWRIKGEPWLAGIDYRLIQEQSQALAAFDAQEIDSVTANNKLEKDKLTQRHGADVDIDNDITGNLWVILMRADGSFTDPRVRQALNMAINRQEFIDLMFFGAAQLSGPIPPGHAAYALEDKELRETVAKFDPKGAAALLAQTGFETSKQFSIKYQVPGDNNAQFAQIIQSQLKKNLGLDVKLIGEDVATWQQQSYLQSKYDGFLVFRTGNNDDPTSYLERYKKTALGRDNPARFFDDEIDGLIAAQKRLLDDNQRAQAIKDIQRKAIAKSAPVFPTVVEVSNSIVWKYVKGRVTGRGSFGSFSGRTYIDKKR